MRTIRMLDIKAETIQMTTKCGNGFSCLSDDRSCLCEVEDNLDSRILFIKSPDRKSCNYRMSFGYSYVCNCPTRKEIYSRYKI